MATRRNHYGDGYSYGEGLAGGGGAQYGYGYGASNDDQHAFPSYSGGRSSGHSKGKKKHQQPGAAVCLAAALAISLLAAGFFLWQGNGLSAKLQAAEEDKKNLQERFTKITSELGMRNKESQKIKNELEDANQKLARAEDKLHETRTQVVGLERQVKEGKESEAKLQETLAKSKNEVAELKARNVADRSKDSELEKERSRSKDLEESLKAKEHQWDNEKRLLNIDLQLARATIEKMELQRDQEQEDKADLKPQAEKATVRREGPRQGSIRDTEAAETAADDDQPAKGVGGEEKQPEVEQAEKGGEEAEGDKAEKRGQEAADKMDGEGVDGEVPVEDERMEEKKDVVIEKGTEERADAEAAATGEGLEKEAAEASEEGKEEAAERAAADGDGRDVRRRATRRGRSENAV